MRCALIFGVLFVYSQLSATDIYAQQNHPGNRTRPARFASFAPPTIHSQQPYPQQPYSEFPQNSQFPEPNYQDGMIFDQPSNGWENHWFTPDSERTTPAGRVNEGNWTSPIGRSNIPGQFPFLLGNIFGLSSEDCCDEWAGHCRCLELTNLRSNCECTNPHRTKQRVPEHSLDTANSADDGFDRTADRKTVSEYFHPRRFR